MHYNNPDEFDTYGPVPDSTGSPLSRYDIGAFIIGLVMIWTILATAVAAGVLAAFWIDARVNVYDVESPEIISLPPAGVGA